MKKINIINKQIEILSKRVTQLEKLLVEALLVIKQRDEKIRILESRLNSKNSSIPPSKDITKASRKTSLRKKTGKKSGGQRGHKGKNLKMVQHPDEVIDHHIIECSVCQLNLENVAQQLVSQQQVFDIPQIKIEVTEHRQYEAVCPCCQTIQRSSYPFTPSKSKTKYGSNITNLVTYLNVRQSMPMKRTQELLELLFGHKISEGTIANILKAQSEKLKPTYDKLRQLISQSKVVGSDETGCTVEGKNHWLWVFQNKISTYLIVSPSRGYKTIKKTFPDGLRSSVLVSDRWAAQLMTPSKEKQLCLAHLIRDCNKLIDRHKSRWAKQLKKVLENIFHLCSQKKIRLTDKEEIEVKLDALFNSPLLKANYDISKLQKSLEVKRRCLTTCLYERYVPPDNNASERAIRKVKVKEKISGGFRSKNGANYYAIIQSIVDTAIKQGLHPFNVLSQPQLILK